jgi:hypothetical protein
MVPLGIERESARRLMMRVVKNLIRNLSSTALDHTGIIGSHESQRIAE